MMRRLDLSIGNRLAIGFGAAGLLIALLAGVAHFWTARVVSIREMQNALIVPRADSADRLENAVLYTAIAARNYLQFPDVAHRRAYDEAMRTVRRERDALDAFPEDERGREILAQVGGRIEVFATASDELMHAAGLPAQVEGLERRMSAGREDLLEAIRRYARLQHEQVEELRRQVTEAVQAVDRAALGFGALALVVFAVTALLTARAVRGPTKELVASARRVGAGDFAHAIELTRPLRGEAPRRDELVELARAFGAMAVDLRSREDRLRAGTRLASGLARSLEPKELCAAALEVLAEQLGLECGAVYLADADGALRLEHGLGLFHAEAVMAAGQGLPGRAAAVRQTVLIGDLPPDSPFTLRLGVDRLPPRAVAAVPMVLQDALVVGVLVVASARPIADETLQFLQRAAAQLGVALQNARSHAHVQRLAGELQARNQRLQEQQEELQSQNEELQVQQEELQSQNEELQAQGEELRRSEELLRQTDRNKNDFLAVLSHELRNPLAPIQNSVHVLEQAAPESPQARRAQEVISRQVRQLARLIEDLLDLTRISNGKVRLRQTPVDLAGVVRQATEDHAAEFAARGVDLRVDLAAAPCVDGDPARLAQALGNLLQNAAKFTPPDGRVDVRLEAEGGRARIRVRDTGAGMDARTLARLFQPFVQADATLARTNGGLGLGLALVKGLVELHGGAVRADSEGPGKGAEFQIELPVREGVVAPPFGVRPERSPPRRVLVIEDNVDAAESLRDALTLGGHAVEIVHRGVEGIARAREWQPDVVLCDIGLPDMEGHQVARELRRDPALRVALLVALTGYALPEDRLRASQAGFDAHLAKPPDLHQLDELLASVAPARARG